MKIKKKVKSKIFPIYFLHWNPFISDEVKCNGQEKFLEKYYSEPLSTTTRLMVFEVNFSFYNYKSTFENLIFLSFERTKKKVNIYRVQWHTMKNNTQWKITHNV